MEKQEIMEYIVIFAAVLIVLALIFTYKGSTAGPQTVSVVSATPASSQPSVAPDSKIVVTFSTAMDRTATEAAFSLTGPSGPVEGTFEWDDENKTMTFAPSSLLEQNATYDAGVSVYAEDGKGNHLSAEVGWQFTTAGRGAGPQVTSVSPNDGATNVSAAGEIIVTFNTAMNMISAEDAFSISPKTSGTFEWGTGNKTMTFRPSQPYMANTQHTVKILTIAKDVGGNKLPSEYSWSFTTSAEADGGTVSNGSGGGVINAPKIISVSPADGATGVSLTADIEITFDRQMNESATNNAFSASPYLSEMYFWNPEHTTLKITPLNPLSPDTQYTLNLSAAAKDAAENPLSSEYVWSFTTQSA